MKKKYITLEEVLALRGTDTKIYDETYQEEVYFQYLDGILCRFYKNELDLIGDSFCKTNKPYILEPEEFKIEKTGKYRTRDGQIAYVVGYIAKDKDGFNHFGMIEYDDLIRYWNKSGENLLSSDRDLVEYIGD